MKRRHFRQIEKILKKFKLQSKMLAKAISYHEHEFHYLINYFWPYLNYLKNFVQHPSKISSRSKLKRLTGLLNLKFILYNMTSMLRIELLLSNWTIWFTLPIFFSRFVKRHVISPMILASEPPFSLCNK